MNSVQLVGRLATDVDMKEVTGGSKVCSFILAVDRNAEEAEFALLQQRMTRRSTVGRPHADQLKVNSGVGQL